MATHKVEAVDRKALQIGMLGYGFMGKCHSHAFKAIPYIYPELNVLPHLLILCGRNLEHVRREAARYGFEEYCTDWRDIVLDKRIEVFDNCGPDPAHPEPCIAALENGKHVICEKPLAVSVDDARKMRDAARKATGKAMCVFNYRFFPAVRLAKDLIASRRLGKIYHIQITYAQMAGHDPSTPSDKIWYSSWPYSGVLQGIGSHALDQCRYLIGEIKSVAGQVGTFNPARKNPNSAAPIDEASGALLEFENGAMGIMVATAVATGRKNALAWEITGSEGALRWSLEHPNTLHACLEGQGDRSLSGFTEISVTDGDHPYAAAWWPTGHTLGWEHAHVIEKSHFLSAIASGTEMSPCLATFEDGYRVAVIIAAIKESSLCGRRIDVQFQ